MFVFPFNELVFVVAAAECLNISFLDVFLHL